MASTLTNTPSRLTAGDSAEWTISLPDYPAPTWTLKYYLVKDGKQIVITGTQYGSTEEHHISVDAATTAAWQPGTYSYQAKASNGTDRKDAGSGTVVIEPDFAQQGSGYDDRSFAKKSLDAIEAVIERRASKSQQEYQIAGRALKFMTMEELLNARDRFRAEVRNQERKKAGKPAFGAVKVRFR